MKAQQQAGKQPDFHLTEAQVAAFRRDGYLVVPGLFGPDDMARIAAWTEELAHWPERPGSIWMYFEQSLTEPGRRLLNRIENFCAHHAGFRELVNSPRIMQPLADLFGEPAVLFKDKINFKMAGGDGFRAHQDVQAGWDRYASLHITALVSIDAATRENGCLEMAPGHHDRGLIGRPWEPLTDEDLEGVEFVTCETRPGDVVFFDSFAPHRSGPNRSDAQRRVLYLTYNRLSEGDHLAQYYADKHASYPPDCERDPERDYRFRV